MKEIEENFVPSPVEEKEVIDINNPSDSFIRLVYSNDPVYNVPRGDLQYLVSDKANPAVKQWILDNIMIDTSGAATPVAPKGISDDDIALLARRSHESVKDYAERVNSFLNENKETYGRLVKAVQDLQPKRNVSADGK